MTTYSQDFNADTVGNPPTGWTARYNTADFTNLVRADTVREGGKYLEQVATASTRKVLSYDAIDGDANRDDIEMLFRFTSDAFDTGSNFQMFNAVRGSGGIGTETNYTVYLNDGRTFGLYKYVSGTGTLLDSVTFGSLTANTYYWVRFRVNGTSIKARIWEETKNEPFLWDVEATDSAVTGVGWAGVGNINPPDQNNTDYISFGTNGDTAPGSPIDDTIALDVAQVPALAVQSSESPILQVAQVPVIVVWKLTPPATPPSVTVVSVIMM